MENTLSSILMVAFLLIGAVGGVILAPEKEVIKEIEKEVFIDVPVEVEVPIEVEIPAVSQLDLAVAEFMKAVEDEEDEAGNDVDVLGSYDFDEVEISRVYDDWSVSYEDEQTTVNFRIKLRFDEDGEASEKETYDVTVIFEEDEDTEVEVSTD